MNREEKAELLSEMNGLISGSEAVVISHYRGLTVAEMGELRKKARELGAELRVTKTALPVLLLKVRNSKAWTICSRGRPSWLIPPTRFLHANSAYSSRKRMRNSWLSAAL